MGIGDITVPAAGSNPVEPDSLPMVLPSGDAYEGSTGGVFDVADLPTIRGVMFSNGKDQLHHIVTNVLKTGLLPPEDAPTVALTAGGVQATALLDFDVVGNGLSVYAPANGETITIGGTVFEFRTTLGSPTSGTDVEILIYGGIPLYPIYNFFISYPSTSSVGGLWNLVSGGVDPRLSITCANIANGYQLTFTAVAHGTVGNTYAAALTSGTFTDCAFGTGSLFTGGADGGGTSPDAGTREFGYAYFRSEDVALSGVSPRAKITTSTDVNVALSAMVAPDDADADYIRIERTAASGLTLYRDQEVDEDDTTATSTIEDDILLEREPFEEAVYNPYAGGYPPSVRCVASYRGKVWGAGFRLAADISTGTASVTVDSNEVTFTGVYLTEAMIGREFRKSAASKRYRIVRIDAASNKAYLGVDYEGSTDGTMAYVIEDTRDPFNLYATETLLPNAWPTTYEWAGIFSPSSAGVTALSAAFGALIAFTKTGVWRVVGDTIDTVEIHHESESVGCVGPKAVVQADGLLWWLGWDGVYVWGGSGDPKCVSRPPALSGEVSGIHATIERLNQRQVDEAVGVWDSSTRVLRWFIPLDDSVTNDHVITLDLNAGSWATDTAGDITAVASVAGGDGRTYILAGNDRGNILQIDSGESDGAYAVQPVQTLSSTSGRVVTLSGSPSLTTDALVGSSFYHVSSGGAFTRYQIASNGAATLTSVTPLGTMAAGDQILLGAIRWELESGWFHLGDLRDEKTVEALTVGFDPMTDANARAWVAWAVDQGTPTVRDTYSTVDLSTSSGKREMPVLRTGAVHKMKLTGFSMGETPAIHALELKVEYANREDR